MFITLYLLKCSQVQTVNLNMCRNSGIFLLVLWAKSFCSRKMQQKRKAQIFTLKFVLPQKILKESDVAVCSHCIPSSLFSEGFHPASFHTSEMLQVDQPCCLLRTAQSFKIQFLSPTYCLPGSAVMTRLIECSVIDRSMLICHIYTICFPGLCFLECDLFYSKYNKRGVL